MRRQEFVERKQEPVGSSKPSSPERALSSRPAFSGEQAENDDEPKDSHQAQCDVKERKCGRTEDHDASFSHTVRFGAEIRATLAGRPILLILLHSPSRRRLTSALCEREQVGVIDLHWSLACHVESRG